MVWQSALNLLYFLGVVLISYDIHQLRELRQSDPREERNLVVTDEKRIVWIDGHGQNPLSTYMRHIREVFEYLGYSIITGDQPPDAKWDLMWIHDYSLTKTKYKSHIEKSKPHQLMNHVPGSGFYTSKVLLATTGLSFGVPKAFQLPSEKEVFLQYAKEYTDTMWVQKDNTHRNIKIRPLDQLDLEKSDSFIQKFVDNPLLIDNRKFDIGVYVVVTSLLPLRVYAYNGDVLLRFCAKDYHPLDIKDVDKYVVGDDYTPIWEIPSLSKFYNDQKLGRRASLDAYLVQNGKDPNVIWLQIGKIIAEVFRKRQTNMVNAQNAFKFDARFFELSRFDFVVDDELNVYLMEANMSPNLSSGHFKQNQILYEQVLLNILSLVGAANSLTKIADKDLRTRSEDSNPIVSDRDIRAFLPFCIDDSCTNCSEKQECALCGHCISKETSNFLKSTYEEHLRKQNMVLVRYNENNFAYKEDYLLNVWLQAKCEQDRDWC